MGDAHKPAAWEHCLSLPCPVVGHTHPPCPALEAAPRCILSLLQLVAAIVFISFGLGAAFCCAVVDAVFAARHIVSLGSTLYGGSIPSGCLTASGLLPRPAFLFLKNRPLECSHIHIHTCHTCALTSPHSNCMHSCGLS